MKILNERNLVTLNESDLLNQYNILASHLANFNKKTDMRVGDFVQDKIGNFRRFTHDWGDTIQTTTKEESGSFNIDGGFCDFSGSLDSAIEKSKITFTFTYKLGRVWFFKDKLPAAHQGIDALVPCRVYRYNGEFRQ